MPRGDSIARYESNDMYTARVPKRNENRPANTVGVRDTVETSEQKEARFNPPKVAPTDGRFSQDRLVVVGKAGRFAFMAICMPPYLLVYGIPKMVAVHLLPQILKLSSATLNYGTNVAANMKNWVVETMLKPFRNAFGKINFAIQNISKGLTSLLSNLKNAITKPVIAAFKAVNKTLNTAGQVLKNTFLKTTPLLQTIKNVFSKVVDQAKNGAAAIKAPFVKTGQVITQVGHHIGNIGIHAQDAASKLSKRTEEITKVLAKKIRSVLENVNETKVKVQQLINHIPNITVIPMINLFIQMRNTIGEYGKFSLKRIKNTGKSLLNTRKRVKSALEGSKKFLSNLPKRARERAAKTMQWVKGPLVEYIKEEIPFLYDFYLFLKRLYSKLIAKCRAVLSFIQEMLARYQAFVKKKLLVVKALQVKVKTKLKKPLSITSARNGMQKITSALSQRVRRAGSAFRGAGRAFGTLFKELHEEVRSWMS